MGRRIRLRDLKQQAQDTMNHAQLLLQKFDALVAEIEDGITVKLQKQNDNSILEFFTAPAGTVFPIGAAVEFHEPNEQETGE